MCSHVLRELHFARISYARALRLSLPLFLHLFRPPFLPPFLAWSLALQEAAYVLMYQKAAASLVGLEDKPKAPTCAAKVEKVVCPLI